MQTVKAKKNAEDGEQTTRRKEKHMKDMKTPTYPKPAPRQGKTKKKQ